MKKANLGVTFYMHRYHIPILSEKYFFSILFLSFLKFDFVELTII